MLTSDHFPPQDAAIKLAKRVEALPPYLFAEISKKIAAKRAEGHDIVTFGIGDPDIPTPKHIMGRWKGADERSPFVPPE